GPNVVLSEVYTGIISPGNSILYNPAAASLNSRVDLNIKTAGLTFERTYARFYIGTALNSRNGIGVSYLTSVRDDTVPAADILYPVVSKESAMIVSYGLHLAKRHDFGINMKYLKNTLNAEELKEIGFDVGWIQSPFDSGFLKNIRIHVSVSDFYSVRISGEAKEKTAPYVIRGGSILPLFNSRLLVGLDFKTSERYGKNLLDAKNFNIGFSTSYGLFRNLNVTFGFESDVSTYAGISYTPPSWYRLDYKISKDSNGTAYWFGVDIRLDSQDRTELARFERLYEIEGGDELRSHYIRALQYSCRNSYDDLIQSLKEIMIILKIKPDYQKALLLKKHVKDRLARLVREFDQDKKDTVRETEQDTSHLSSMLIE
ncbi:MAG: hypothetical protein PHF84_09800, partial [bacterium]|nr:hypothetical protein [bacterium]